LSEYKFAVDLQSRMITAREDGREEGIEIGTVKGRELERQDMLALLRQQGYDTAELERQLAGS
jgi:uncharacterized membrane protein